MRLRPGDPAPRFEAIDLDGRGVAPARAGDRHVLLAFLRYASCPMCLLRIDELVRETPALEAAGVDVVVVLHSARERILRHMRRPVPFSIVPDPRRRLYRLYGVETSWGRLLWSAVQPSFYARWARATLRGYLGGAIDGEFARMPADFLIAPDGRIALAHYGVGIGSHMSLRGIAQHVGARR